MHCEIASRAHAVSRPVKSIDKPNDVSHEFMRTGKGLRKTWERIASDDAFGTFSHVVLGGGGRSRLGPQTKRRLFDVHEFRRVTGAAWVFIRIKITLDG